MPEVALNRYSRVLALLTDGLPKKRIGRFWEAIPKR